MAVALNPGGLGGIQGNESTDDMAGVQAYVENLDVSLLPIGMEETAHYSEWATNFPGANPFPIDIIVDKQGIVRYVAREYDAPTMHTIVQELLAE
ncbi:MAG TPA: hypothetical protein VFU21_06740 [Kofleriaceae bacterium]|nr:hypothetical protein [Kofleriaceae bacterium]